MIYKDRIEDVIEIALRDLAKEIANNLDNLIWSNPYKRALGMYTGKFFECKYKL